MYARRLSFFDSLCSSSYSCFLESRPIANDRREPPRPSTSEPGGLAREALSSIVSLSAKPPRGCDVLHPLSDVCVGPDAARAELDRRRKQPGRDQVVDLWARNPNPCCHIFDSKELYLADAHVMVSILFLVLVGAELRSNAALHNACCDDGFFFVFIFYHITSNPGYPTSRNNPDFSRLISTEASGIHMLLGLLGAAANQHVSSARAHSLSLQLPTIRHQQSHQAASEVLSVRTIYVVFGLHRHSLQRAGHPRHPTFTSCSLGRTPAAP